MAAIVRVKRRRDIDPADAFIISCKKSKLQNESQETPSQDNTEVKEYFKFAGTVSENDQELTKHIRDAIRKEKLEKEYKKHNVDCVSKVRQEHKLVTKNERYKIIASKRALNLDSLNDDEKVLEEKVIKSEISCECEKTVADMEAERLFCLYDVEQEKSEKLDIHVPQVLGESTSSTITCNSVPLVREKVAPPDADFVYDLYYTNRQDFDFRMLENILNIEACREDYVYEDYRNDYMNEIYDDEDDSNDENNWRNDYPDEDPHIYDPIENYEYGEDDLSFGMVDLMGGKCKINTGREDEDQYSSEEEDEELYNMRWGNPVRSYEVYKQRLMTETKSDESDQG